jgi:hypothetical protein
MMSNRPHVTGLVAGGRTSSPSTPERRPPEHRLPDRRPADAPRAGSLSSCQVRAIIERCRKNPSGG